MSTTGLLVALAGLTSFAEPAAAQSTCTQLSVPTMALGTYTGSLSTTGTVSGTLTCLVGTPYSLGLSKGAGAGATTTNRMLTSGSATLTYQLFQDSALATNWGDIGGAGTKNGLGASAAQTFGVYPKIPAGQLAPPGSYTDTITASINDFGTRTTTFMVTASILPSCTLTATNLGFGTYSGAQLDATSTLSVTCTNTTPYNVGLSAGNANAATVTTRRMQGRDSNGLLYALFRDTARSLNWGNTNGTDTLAGTGNGSAQMLTVYGRIATGQRIAPANYTDTIVVTLTY